MATKKRKKTGGKPKKRGGASKVRIRDLESPKGGARGGVSSPNVSKTGLMGFAGTGFAG
jgi:hypothetical protein